MFLSTVVQSITSNQDTIVAIWNSAAGQNSQNASVGVYSGEYPSNEGPSNCMDLNCASKYLNFGTANQFSSSYVAGVGTGFYAIPIIGATVATFFQMQKGNDNPSRDPITCTLEGSNMTGAALTMGSSWTLLYNGSTGINSTVDPGRSTWATVQSLSSRGSFTAYRFLVTSQRDFATCVQYSEFRLLY